MDDRCHRHVIWAWNRGDAAKCLMEEHHVYLGALIDAQIVTVSNDCIARRWI